MQFCCQQRRHTNGIAGMGDTIGTPDFAHTGGFPLGLAIDRDDNIISCIGAMGLYAISPRGEVKQLSAETSRSGPSAWRLSSSAVSDARPM